MMMTMMMMKIMMMIMILVAVLFSCGNENDGIKMKSQQAMKKIIYDMILMWNAGCMFA